MSEKTFWSIDNKDFWFKVYSLPSMKEMPLVIMVDTEIGYCMGHEPDKDGNPQLNKRMTETIKYKTRGKFKVVKMTEKEIEQAEASLGGRSDG